MTAEQQQLVFIEHLLYTRSDDCLRVGSTVTPLPQRRTLEDRERSHLALHHTFSSDPA